MARRPPKFHSEHATECINSVCLQRSWHSGNRRSPFVTDRLRYEATSPSHPYTVKVSSLSNLAIHLMLTLAQSDLARLEIRAVTSQCTLRGLRLPQVLKRADISSAYSCNKPNKNPNAYFKK